MLVEYFSYEWTREDQGPAEDPPYLIEDEPRER
jgi:hypothetical protein